MAGHTVHATCVALEGAGVLLRGRSGAGKSDLALRLLAEGAALVADDQCLLEVADGRLVARTPDAIAGRIEARGLGVVALPAAAAAPVALVADLRARTRVQRLPEPDHVELMGVRLPRIELDPFAASAPAKLRLALGMAGATLEPADAAPSDVGASAGDRPRSAAADQAVPSTCEAAGERRLRVVLVTGMSGAGRATALKTLEDLGYEAVDNLPLQLLFHVVHEIGPRRALALGADIRTRNFAVEPFLEALRRLAAEPDVAVDLVFLDCDNEALHRRFTETRRRHPLAQGRPVSDGIAAERGLVEPLRQRADLLIDTTTMTPADLRRLLAAQLGLESTGGMTVFVTSFSYRNGLPREADLVLDTRFLANPHYDEALRPLDGRDPRVAGFVEADPDYAGFFARVTGLLRPLLPRYQREGKSYLTIAVGCTGGRHRSVVVAERLAAWLGEQSRQVVLRHRDLGTASGDDAKDARDEDSR